MVIVPVLLTTVPDIEDLLDRLEVAAFANMDPVIHFAILSDFVDAPERDMPEDAALLEAARAGIETLNERHGSPAESRFFLFHRARQWNERDQVWMGWERKRGKDRGVQQAAARVRRRRASKYRSGRPTSFRRCVIASRSIRIRACRVTRPGNSWASSGTRSTGRESIRCRAGSPRDTASCSRASASRWRAPPARCSPAFTPATRASIPTPRPCRISIRICSARGSSPAKASTMSTRSRRPSRTASPKTRSFPTISSRVSLREPRSYRTSRSWTTIRRASSPTRDDSTDGSGETGRSCSGCSRSCRRGPGWSATVCRSSRDGRFSTT